jgi:hypothetical protein
MKNEKSGVLALLALVLIIFIVSSCFNEPINVTKNEGTFSKTNTDIITNEYNIKSNKGFYAEIDFNLIEGKVQWEIVDPKGEKVFMGYVVNENGKTYRELEYPKYPNKHMNKKEEVKDVSDFNYLQFESGNFTGVYKLNLTSINAEGNYTVQWNDSLPKK